MPYSALDIKMKSCEAFSVLQVPIDKWIILRVDGKAFHTLTANCEKPFDFKLHDAMVNVARYLIHSFDGAVLAYTHSDECSLVLPPLFDLYNRRVEKLVSISAAAASVAFKDRACPVLFSLAVFDSRIWLGDTSDEVIEYLSWRQADCYRCCVNSYAHWNARESGLSARQATSLLDVKSKVKHDYLYTKGINISEVPAWQRRGTMVYWCEYEKVGFNPLTKETVPVTRKYLHTDHDLNYGREFVQQCKDILRP